MDTLCGADCSGCVMKKMCKGCAATGGRPLGGDCVMASCLHSRGYQSCSECVRSKCESEAELIEEINSQKIKDMPKITGMYELAGRILNLEYPLPNGQRAKFWDDKSIYWGCQIKKTDSDRYYGVAADDKYLMISEYGENETDPHVVFFQSRKDKQNN